MQAYSMSTRLPTMTFEKSRGWYCWGRARRRGMRDGGGRCGLAAWSLAAALEVVRVSSTITKGMVGNRAWMSAANERTLAAVLPSLPSVRSGSPTTKARMPRRVLAGAGFTKARS